MCRAVTEELPAGRLLHAPHLASHARAGGLPSADAGAGAGATLAHETGTSVTHTELTDEQLVYDVKDKAMKTAVALTGILAMAVFASAGEEVLACHPADFIVFVLRKLCKRTCAWPRSLFAPPVIHQLLVDAHILAAMCGPEMAVELARRCALGLLLHVARRGDTPQGRAEARNGGFDTRTQELCMPPEAAITGVVHAFAQRDPEVEAA
ncbi:hypothetical protein WJX81_007497 [Elliptochloris bilobata]|uniref:Uncharacterized protein n=1 Tax=Elliptochloris bilobata TaxID=381761 RepID=A0AAW1S9K7_9CHLO